ncbi:MAG TPA: NADP-dependent oxidoreductase [Chloroflexota bacterium]|jgi:NADPH:quinone reductase-like Zn-dependent oxidoreductase|nr:NADP-dependent oxidoreductase [Chloroflexota bacterium]
MKAMRFHQYGSPDVLRYEDIDQPIPGPGEVRLHVAATSFNPVDAAIRAGFMRQVFPVALPHVPGIDVAGTVDALGTGVSGLRVGDAVIGFLPMVADGAAAEYALAPAEVLAAAPTTIPLAEAAALPAVGLTAWQALFEHAGVRPGQRVLVNGAGGAVGGYAVQLAKRAGAEVLATASPRSLERVRAAGADLVIDHTATNVPGAVNGSLDVVLNVAPVEPQELAALTALIRPGGLVLSTTTPASGDESRRVRGVQVYVRSDAERLAKLVALIDAGQLHVNVAERVPLAELPRVHTQAVTGALPGKVVLVPAA